MRIIIFSFLIQNILFSSDSFVQLSSRGRKALKREVYENVRRYTLNDIHSNSRVLYNTLCKDATLSKRSIYYLFSENEIVQLGNNLYSKKYFEDIKNIKLSDNFAEFKKSFFSNDDNLNIIEIAWLLNYYKALGGKKNIKFINILVNKIRELKKNELIALYNHMKYKFTVCDLKYLADNRNNRKFLLGDENIVEKMNILDRLLVSGITKKDLLKFENIEIDVWRFAKGEKKLTELNINKSINEL